MVKRTEEDWVEYKRLHEIVQKCDSTISKQVAVDAEEGVWTYSELNRECVNLSDYLHALGVKSGDRIMIVAENSVVQVAAIMGCSMLDAWAVLVNARVSFEELQKIHTHCSPKVIIFSSSVSSSAVKHAARFESEEVVVGRLSFHVSKISEGVVQEEVFESAAEQTAVMIYTTGTTGAPKGVMLTHRNLLFTAFANAKARGITSSDCSYAALPMTHVYGLTTVVLSSFVGGGSVLLRAKFDVFDLIESLKNRVTLLYGVPAMYTKLLDVESQGYEVIADKLRSVHCGGAPMEEQVKNRVVELFGGLPINNGYGMTETSPSICAVPFNEHGEGLTVGFLIDGLEAKIVNEQGQYVSQGEIGELVVRGPNVMKGYYKDPVSTSKVLSEDGWFRTEDLVKQDRAGRFYIIGRIKELIIRSGFNVYPTEVEAAINRHPAVSGCCVVGKKVGSDEKIIAFIEIKDGQHVDEEGIDLFLVDYLAPYKRPQKIVFMKSLPSSSTGKILRGKLKSSAGRLNF